MEAATQEHVVAATTPAISDERRDEIRDELSGLDAQERAAIEALGKAQEELARIQGEKRELMQELLDGESALELTPAMADEAIAALRQEFDRGADGAREEGYVVQEGMDFTAVEAKLRAEENAEKLKAVYRMVQAGSRPAVVCEEGGRYCIAETFGQTLPERANCVYDREAEEQVDQEKCNGNAVTQSQKMGVPLMERRVAQTHITGYQYCSDFIQATQEERERGCAPFVDRDFGGVRVFVGSARGHCDGRGWRGALWV